MFPYIYNLIICTITMGSIRRSLLSSISQHQESRINAERDLQNYKGNIQKYISDHPKYTSIHTTMRMISIKLCVKIFLVFRMTSIMVAGFSFTMLPYGIICMIFYTSSIDCQGHTLPYTMITFLR